MITLITYSMWEFRRSFKRIAQIALMLDAAGITGTIVYLSSLK